MRVHLFYLFLSSFALLLAGCGPQLVVANSNPPSNTLTVFAAASLTEPFTEIAQAFEATHPGTDIELNFAGSQALRLQIEQGAHADIFASANEDHIQALVEAGLLQTPVIFTQNRLAVIVPAENPASIETLADLAQPGLKLILASQNVPAGRYARQTLDNLNDDPLLGADYSVWVLNNLVSEEDNVKGVLAKIRLGEADAGIVYASDITLAAAADLITIPIPSDFNVKAVYPIAIAAQSPQPVLAQRFVDFALSMQGQNILANHGFQPAQTRIAGQQ
jgi:molybdate transport system substrate-binding protein